MATDHPKSLQEIAAESRYPIDAFHFVRRGLDYTVHRIHAHPEQLPEEQRHVSGRQLSYGLRDFALEQYGLLARTVLGRWRIHRTSDFGRVVFAMVEGGLMQATEQDSVRDFEGVYDLGEALAGAVPLNKVPREGIEAKPVEQG